MLIGSSHYAWRDSRESGQEHPPSAVPLVFQRVGFFFFWAPHRVYICVLHSIALATSLSRVAEAHSRISLLNEACVHCTNALHR